MLRDSASFLHHYQGYTWATMMELTMGTWKFLVREMARQRCEDAHLDLTVQHTGDVKDLEERLRYGSHPEEAYWSRPAMTDTEIDATLARVRKP